MTDIVITAERRESSVQRTPLAITAISGDLLKGRQLLSVQDLTGSVPGLNVGNAGGQARIAIRGLSFDSVVPGEEGRIAFYVDDVYIARPFAQTAGFFDVARVEVLRGPQGTLYGRNATGGALNVVSNQPTSSWHGDAEVTFGNYGLIETDAAISGPLVKGVDARLALKSVDRNGYGRDIVTGQDVDDAKTRSLRASTKIDLGGTMTASLSASYHHEHDHAYGYHYQGSGNGMVPIGIRLGGIVSPNPRDTAGDVTPTNDRTIWMLAGKVQWELSPAIKLRSVTGYVHAQRFTGNDLDSTSFPVAVQTIGERSREVSEELQLQGETDRSNWIVGAYYYRENDFGQQRIIVNKIAVGGPNVYGDGIYFAGTQVTQSLAAFGQYRRKFGDKLSVTLGARYTRDRKEIDDNYQAADFRRTYVPGNPLVSAPGFPRSAAKSFGAFTPKLSVEYTLAPHILAYATYSRGFKSGGFTFGQNAPAFRPEKLSAYEGGFKSEFLNRHVRLNVAGFYYDYKDLQVTVVRSAFATTENAGSAVIYGGEVEGVLRPFDRFQLDFSGSYNHSRYIDLHTVNPAFPALGIQDQSGNELLRAPEFTVNAGAQYTVPVVGGDLTFRGEYLRVADTYFSVFQQKSDWQPEYGLANAFVTWRSADNRWRLSAFVRNIANRTIRSASLVSGSLWGTPLIGTYLPPRTYGASVGVGF